MTQDQICVKISVQEEEWEFPADLDTLDYVLKIIRIRLFQQMVLGTKAKESNG